MAKTSAGQIGIADESSDSTEEGSARDGRQSSMERCISSLFPIYAQLGISLRSTQIRQPSQF